MALNSGELVRHDAAILDVEVLVGVGHLDRNAEVIDFVGDGEVLSEDFLQDEAASLEGLWGGFIADETRKVGHLKIGASDAVYLVDDGVGERKRSGGVEIAIDEAMEDEGEIGEIQIEVGNEVVSARDAERFLAAGFFGFFEGFDDVGGVGGELNPSDMDRAGSVATVGIYSGEFIFFLGRVKGVDEVVQRADGDAAEFVVIVEAAEGVIDEFWLFYSVF